MRRRALALLAAFVVGAGLLAAAPPAQASLLSDKACWTYDWGLAPPPYVCMEVTYYAHTNGSSGMTLRSMHIWIVPNKVAAFETNAIDPCSNLRIWNDADVVKWRRDNDGTQTCKLSRGNPDKFWPSLDIDMPQTNSISEGWTFDANMDQNPDRDDVHIGADQYN